MKGKWARGIPPRFFAWIIKGHLAVSERPGGYARNHRKVRRQEEILWLRGEGFTRVVSLLPSPHNLHAYDELGVTWSHVPFGPHDDPAVVLADLYARLKDWLSEGERILVHQEELGDRLMGVVGRLPALVRAWCRAVRRPSPWSRRSWAGRWGPPGGSWWRWPPRSTATPPSPGTLICICLRWAASDGRRSDGSSCAACGSSAPMACSPRNRQRAQPFEVDLDLEVDLRRAGRSDALADTVDYGAVSAAVAAVVGGPHADLLEHLAERIAAAALTCGAPHATAVTVQVRKTRPPVPFELASAGVTIHRRRDDLAS